MAINQVLLLIGDLLIGLWQHLLNLRFKQNHVEYLYPHWTTNWILSCYLWSPSDEIPWEHPEKRFLGVQKSFCSEISIVLVTSCWLSITKPNPPANTLPGQSGTMSDPGFPHRACSWPLHVSWHPCPASPCAQGLSQGWGCLSVPQLPLAEMEQMAWDAKSCPALPWWVGQSLLSLNPKEQLSHEAAWLQEFKSEMC